LDGAVYGHASFISYEFMRYVVATRTWEVLPSPPTPCLRLGAADPVAHEYSCIGPILEKNLYRFDADTKAWRTTRITPVAVDEGCIAWLPTSSGGLFILQGDVIGNHVGFTRLVTAPPLLRIEPRSGIVPPLGDLEVVAHLDASRSQAGTHPLEIRIAN